MDDEQQQPEPRDIEVFYPQSVDLIDRQRQAEQAYGAAPRRLNSRRRLALVLFLATCVTTFMAGMVPGAGHIVPQLLISGEFFSEEVQQILGPLPKMLEDGAIFSASLMAILLFHEMGHFLQAKRYGVPATWPFFIPMPISPFGTMGAVIVQGAGVADRKSLFDIAISGPLAGLAVALPITYFGLRHAGFIHPSPGGVGMSYGDPLLLRWMSRLINGPLPAGMDIELNAMLFAGWVGIFITALNLIPVGQFDGGHILYTLIGKRAHRIAIVVLWGGVAYMFLSGNWTYMLIAVLLFIFGAKHPPTADDRVELGWLRKLLGWLTLCFVFVGFTPDPLHQPAPEPDEPKQKQADPADLVRAAPFAQIAQASRSPAPLGNALPRSSGARRATSDVAPLEAELRSNGFPSRASEPGLSASPHRRVRASQPIAPRRSSS